MFAEGSARSEEAREAQEAEESEEAASGKTLQYKFYNLVGTAGPGSGPGRRPVWGRVL